MQAGFRSSQVEHIEGEDHHSNDEQTNKDILHHLENDPKHLPHPTGDLAYEPLNDSGADDNPSNHQADTSANKAGNQSAAREKRSQDEPENASQQHGGDIEQFLARNRTDHHPESDDDYHIDSPLVHYAPFLSAMHPWRGQDLLPLG